jgi:hypothetical protein
MATNNPKESQRMKRILIAMMLCGVAGQGVSRAADAATAETLVWCGLDYSMVKMIGTTDFAQPQQIFPGMLVAWNGLFMKEMLPNLEKMAKSVVSDLKAVEARNEKAGPSQIEREDGSRQEKVDPTDITEAILAGTVRSYELKNETGLGLVFVMDRLVKVQETGCMHVVFFDIATRKVVHSERLCEGAGGFGFRNYWFSPVKRAVKKLPNMYKPLKSRKG